MEVVLVHSGVTDSGEWEGVRPFLEQAGHHVLAPDQPGYGSAPLPPGEHSLAEIVLGFFEDRASLVGTSFGGRGVLEAAFAAPDRIEALVLVNANPFGWSEEVQRIAEEEEALFESRRFDGHPN